MQGLFSGVWGLSSVVGPLIGGFITDQWSWRWVFYLNLPVGIAAAIIIGIALVEEKREERPKIDYAGAFVLTAAVTLLLLIFSEGKSPRALLEPRALALMALIVGLFSLFRNRVVTVSIIVGFLAGVAMFAAITFVPLLAQGVLGTTATAAGSLLTPLLLSWVFTSIVGGRLLIKLGSRPLVIAGLALMIAGFFALASFHKTTPWSTLIIELVVIGAGLGLVMLTLHIAAQHSVPREQLGITTSLNQFSRSIGGALGIALLGAVLASGLASFSDNPNALVSAEARAQMAPATLVALQHALEGTLRNIFLICAIIVFVSLVISLALPGGKVESAHTERMVMAEMTTIDAEHEPEC